MLLPYIGAAQPALPKILDFNSHGWYVYSGDHPVSGPWGVHLEGQWRRADLGLRWQQLFVRPALNYRISDTLMFSIGYGFAQTYPYGDFPVRAAFPEHRIYQQVLVRQPVRVANLQHRFRLEQRFVRYPQPQPLSWTYQNRFRYFGRADFPLTRYGNGEAEWYLPVSNEIFIGMPPNYGARPFDQNRLSVGIGRSFGAVNVEVGYLNQFLGQRNGRIFEFNNTLFVMATSTVPISRLWSSD
jgi:hypothetical protein